MKNQLIMGTFVVILLIQPMSITYQSIDVNASTHDKFKSKFDEPSNIQLDQEEIDNSVLANLPILESTIWSNVSYDGRDDEIWIKFHSDLKKSYSLNFTYHNHISNQIMLYDSSWHEINPIDTTGDYETILINYGNLTGTYFLNFQQRDNTNVKIELLEFIDYPYKDIINSGSIISLNPGIHEDLYIQSDYLEITLPEQNNWYLEIQIKIQYQFPNHGLISHIVRLSDGTYIPYKTHNQRGSDGSNKAVISIFNTSGHILIATNNFNNTQSTIKIGNSSVLEQQVVIGYTFPVKIPTDQVLKYEYRRGYCYEGCVNYLETKSSPSILIYQDLPFIRDLFTLNYVWRGFLYLTSHDDPVELLPVHKLYSDGSLEILQPNMRQQSKISDSRVIDGDTLRMDTNLIETEIRRINQDLIVEAGLFHNQYSYTYFEISDYDATPLDEIYGIYYGISPNTVYDFDLDINESPHQLSFSYLEELKIKIGKFDPNQNLLSTTLTTMIADTRFFSDGEEITEISSIYDILQIFLMPKILRIEGINNSIPVFLEENKEIFLPKFGDYSFIAGYDEYKGQMVDKYWVEEQVDNDNDGNTLIARYDTTSGMMLDLTIFNTNDTLATIIDPLRSSLSSGTGSTDNGQASKIESEDALLVSSTSSMISVISLILFPVIRQKKEQLF